MSDDVIMTAVEYERIDRGMTKLTDGLAAATSRAERAEAAIQRVRGQLDWMAWLTQDERAPADHREGLKRFLDVIRAALDGDTDE